MLGNDTNWKGRLAKWSMAAFLVAGVLVSVAAVAMGVVVATELSQGMITALPLTIGLLITYFGMLGLYPQLVPRARRSALVGVVLLVFPVVGLIVLFGYGLIVGREPSFIGPLLAAVFVGFALGVTLFGLTSYRTRTPSRGVGLGLLMFAAPWFVLLGSRVIYAGGKAPAWLDFVTTGVMAVSLLAVGYLLWSGEPATETEPTPEPTT